MERFLRLLPVMALVGLSACEFAGQPSQSDSELYRNIKSASLIARGKYSGIYGRCSTFDVNTFDPSEMVDIQPGEQYRVHKTEGNRGTVLVITNSKFYQEFGEGDTSSSLEAIRSGHYLITARVYREKLIFTENPGVIEEVQGEFFCS